MEYPRLLTKEEYDELIIELRENSAIFLEQFQRYKKMLEIMPGAYNDSREDYDIYMNTLNEINLKELLELQHRNVVNISNQFDESFAIINRDIDEINKINSKYNNRLCKERKREIALYYKYLENEMIININCLIPSICVVGSL